MDNTTQGQQGQGTGPGNTDAIQLFSPRSGKPAITVSGLNALRNVGAPAGLPANNVRFNADASTEDLVDTFRHAEQLYRAWPAIRDGVARELEHRGVNVGAWRSGTTLDAGSISSGREPYGHESRR